MAEEQPPRKSICRRCGVVLLDGEPMSTTPDFRHIGPSDCPLANVYMKSSEWIAWRPKKVRRARNRGAKLARRLRP